MSTGPRRVQVSVNGKLFDVEIADLNASPLSVIVNGQPYTVTVETGGAAPAAAALPAPAATPAPAAVTRTAPPAARTVPAAGGSGQVRAPMPGNILDVAVKPGDSVTQGQPLCALEAMKMKSPIRSPRAGRVLAVHVSDGQSVAHGDLLVSLE
jgi:biotin carboxyl carrier protein